MIFHPIIPCLTDRQEVEKKEGVPVYRSDIRGRNKFSPTGNADLRPVIRNLC